MIKEPLRVFAATVSGLCLGAGCEAALAQSGQSAGSSADQLGEVVVTARRVEERAQDVPISMEVLNAQKIQERNLTSAEDLVLYTPSLSIATNSVIGRDNASFSLRGFTQVGRTTASVATYFGDVPAPRPGSSIAAGDGAGPGMLFDIQSIQVLKGPQGTLFGRNTTGGAVLIVPNKPGESFGGYVEALGGSYDWHGLQGAVNLPMTSNLRARIAVEYQKREGFTQTSGIDATTGQPFSTRLDDRDFIALRGSLVWDMTENLQNYLILYSSHSTTNGSSQPVVGCDPAVATGPFVCTPLGGNAFAAQQARTSAYTSSDLAHPHSDIEQYGAINNTSWQVADNLTIKNVLSYQGLVTDMASDLFGTDINIPPGALAPGYPFQATHLIFTNVASLPGYHTTDESTMTEELQLQGNSLNYSLKWQGGVYVEDDLPLGWSAVRSASAISCQNWLAANSANLNCSDTLGSGIPGTYAGDVEDRLNKTSYHDYGLYAQGTYDLSEHWAITAGARYTVDQVNATGEGAFFHFEPGFYTPPVQTVCSKPQVTYNPALGLSGCAVDFSTRSSAPTWVIDTEYKPTSDLMAYLKYARGYRQGSVSTDAAPGFEEYKPEHVDTYEAGVKSTFDVGPVATLLDAAVFYNNLRDQQLTTGVYVDNTLTDAILNGGKSRIWGAELDASLRPFSSLVVDIDYTYLNTDLESITLPVTPPGVILSPSYQVGRPLPFAPNNKGTVSLTYTLPLDRSIGQVRLGATEVYISQQINGPDANPFRFVPSVALLNLNAAWNNVFGGPCDISFFATNVANKHYLETVTDLNGSNTVGFESGRYGEPRMLGAKIRYRFGSEK
jgi:iron complex outermembrane recepter protein